MDKDSTQRQQFGEDARTLNSALVDLPVLIDNPDPSREQLIPWLLKFQFE